jgi:hypothetical protein
MAQPLNEMFSFFDMLPSHKIKMASYYVKNNKMFRRNIGLSRHLDFLVWQQCFYFYIALKLQHI